MKKAIWKFTLEASSTIIDMPKDASILSVQTQNDIPCIWALVSIEAEKEKRCFDAFQTGQHISCDIERKYIGTVQLSNGDFVIHIFERLS